MIPGIIPFCSLGDLFFINPSSGLYLDGEAQGAQASPNSHLIDVPSFVRDGDFVLMLDTATGASTPSTVVVSGWTSHSNITGTGAGVDANIRSILSSKLFTSADTGTTLTGMNGSEIERKIMWILRPTRKIISYTVTVAGHQITSGNPTAQTVDATSARAPALTFGLAASRGTINTFAWGAAITPDDTNPASTTRAGSRFFPTAASLASGNIDTVDEDDFNVLCSGYVEFTV